MIFLLTVFAIPTAGFSQEALNLSGGQRWLVFASRQDATEAVQLAEGYRDALQGTAYEDKVRVVRSDNGWFAVVVGPAHFKSIRLARAEFNTVLPEDAYLSRGRRYVETVWPDRDRQFDEFENQAHFTLELEKLRVNADLIVEQTDPNDAFSKTPTCVLLVGLDVTRCFRLRLSRVTTPNMGRALK
ncbi:hypothetical protein [Pseudovibrio denitrificans]|uniref:hypothetical protein n=1 Tax=Pseudovibrio denitrificans TaxID=258256 RepID=UPI001AD8C3C7|nr:hypothetical protein [Pseudovibrio denitrificans]